MQRCDVILNERLIFAMFSLVSTTGSEARFSFRFGKERRAGISWSQQQRPFADNAPEQKTSEVACDLGGLDDPLV